MESGYVNRRGDRYYVFQGQTKTGKPKYYASKSETSKNGQRIAALPEGFEIFENPANARVTIRRRKTSQIVEAERELIEQLVIELSACSHTQTIIDGNRIVVYTTDSDLDSAAARLAKVFGCSLEKAAECIARTTNYDAELRFTLVDADERLYTAERFCYRSSIDDWIWLDGPAPLESLARRLVPHLGKDSFFDLM